MRSELLTSLIGNVEKMNARVGELERKVQGSWPQDGKKKDDIRAFGARVRELELFKDVLLEFVHTYFNIRITEFERYLVSQGFQPTMAPAPSAPPATPTSNSFSSP